MLTPGALTLGFTPPKSDGPREENEAMLSPESVAPLANNSG